MKARAMLMLPVLMGLAVASEMRHAFAQAAPQAPAQPASSQPASASPAAAQVAGATNTAAPPANPAAPPSAPAMKSKEELEKLVEPIALHPDPLIAIILPASAYPLEIVQAA